MTFNENNVPESEEEQVTPENDTTPLPENKPNFFKKIGSKISSFGVNIVTKVEEKIENKKLNTAIDKAFYAKCETFIVIDLAIKNTFSSCDFKAIRNAEPNVIYVKTDEKLLDKLKSGVKISANSDHANFEVQENYGDVEYPVSIDENTHHVTCRRIRLKFIEKESPSPTQTVFNQNITQSINVTGDGNQINQIANINDQLTEIENHINNCTPSFLQHGKKKDARILFGNFKECILSKKEDLSLFEKFKSSLKSLGLDIAVSLVTALITQTFN